MPELIVRIIFKFLRQLLQYHCLSSFTNRSNWQLFGNAKFT